VQPDGGAVKVCNVSCSPSLFGSEILTDISLHGLPELMISKKSATTYSRREGGLKGCQCDFIWCTVKPRLSVLPPKVGQSIDLSPSSRGKPVQRLKWGVSVKSYWHFHITSLLMI